MRRTSSRARRALIQLAPLIVVGTLVGIAASDGGGNGEARSRKREGLQGAVAIDGAGAMRGLLDRAAERFHRRHSGVRVTVGASGDESAIALFCAGEVDIAGVARRLDPPERRDCRRSGTRYSEVEVAGAPIAVVVSEGNGFLHRLDRGQLKAIWRRTGPAATWADVDPSLPDVALEPVGGKPDSAPATLLAEALFGPVDPLMRDDYEVTDGAGELTRAVASSVNAIGYLPLAQLKPGSGLRAVRVMQRPLYFEVSEDSLRERSSRRFVREYLSSPPAARASDGTIAVEPSHRIYRKFTRP